MLHPTCCFDSTALNALTRPLVQLLCNHFWPGVSAAVSDVTCQWQVNNGGASLARSWKKKTDFWEVVGDEFPLSRK